MNGWTKQITFWNTSSTWGHSTKCEVKKELTTVEVSWTCMSTTNSQSNRKWTWSVWTTPPVDAQYSFTVAFFWVHNTHTPVGAQYSFTVAFFWAHNTHTPVGAQHSFTVSFLLSTQHPHFVLHVLPGHTTPTHTTRQASAEVWDLCAMDCSVFTLHAEFHALTETSWFDYGELRFTVFLLSFFAMLTPDWFIIGVHHQNVWF